MFKKIVPLLLSSAMLLTAASVLCTAAHADDTDTAQTGSGAETNVRYNYGLHVEEDGSITLEGKPFWGFGLNYFGAFCHYEGGSLSYDDMKDAFPQIAAHNIPFVRLPLGGFYPDYYDRFYADPEAAFAKMQAVLDAAAENHVGVVVSLLWWDASLPEYAGGKRSDMGNSDSETMRVAKDYVAAVVSRFVNHPAVWGWEIGNEYNLDADLCDGACKDYLWSDGTPGFVSREKDGFDYYTSEEMKVFFTELSAVIREIDAYRMISSGNSEMRISSWHLNRSAKRANKRHIWSMDWTMDSKKQFEEIVALMTPGETDTVSFHLQFGNTDWNNPAYVLTADRAGTYGMSLADYFKLYKETADKLGKGTFFGEFGDFITMDNAPDMPEKFREIAGWVTDAGIQIAALWQYQDFADTGAGALKYDVLADLNAAFREAGLQDMETPWGEHQAIVCEPVTEPAAATEAETAADTEAEAATAAPAESDAESRALPADTAAGTDDGQDTDAPAASGCTSMLNPVTAAAVILTAVGSVLVGELLRRRKHP